MSRFFYRGRHRQDRTGTRYSVPELQVILAADTRPTPGTGSRFTYDSDGNLIWRGQVYISEMAAGETASIVLAPPDGLVVNFPVGPEAVPA